MTRGRNLRSSVSAPESTRCPAVRRATGRTTGRWLRTIADAEIKATLRADGIAVQSCPGNVLVEPWDIATGQGRPYSVFTPFWKALRNARIAGPLPPPEGGEPRPESTYDYYRCDATWRELHAWLRAKGVRDSSRRSIRRSVLSRLDSL